MELAVQNAILSKDHTTFPLVLMTHDTIRINLFSEMLTTALQRGALSARQPWPDVPCCQVQHSIAQSSLTAGAAFPSYRPASWESAGSEEGSLGFLSTWILAGLLGMMCMFPLATRGRCLIQEEEKQAAKLMV